MQSVRVSSQLLVSVVCIAVPENLKFLLTLVRILFLASMQSYSYTHIIEKNTVFICTGRIIAWL